MGRPVRKDVAGTEVFGDYTNGAIGIRCDAYIGSLQTDVFIVKQKGSRRYLVQDKSAGTQAVCKLVSGTPAAAGEMKLVGYTTTGHATPITLRSLKKRTATDWSGNRYTWILQNDSSADYILLTRVTHNY